MYFDHIYFTLLPLSPPSSIPSSSPHSSTPSKLHILSSHFKWPIDSNLCCPHTHGIGDMHWNTWSAYQDQILIKQKVPLLPRNHQLSVASQLWMGVPEPLSFHARLITDLILCRQPWLLWVYEYCNPISSIKCSSVWSSAFDSHPSPVLRWHLSLEAQKWGWDRYPIYGWAFHGHSFSAFFICCHLLS